MDPLPVVGLHALFFLRAWSVTLFVCLVEV